MKKFFLLSLFSLSCFHAQADKRPNVVVILADDMGYGDVRALNPSSKVPTPHLDALASAGVTFTDAHSGSGVCTPTRYGLLTGRYCWRSRLKSGVLFPPRDKPLIENDRPTIASFLKAHGYQTAMVGKWHLGISWGLDKRGKVDFNLPFTDGPIEKGFEQWFGIAASLDMVPYTWLRDHQAVTPATENQPKLGFPRYVRNGPKAPDFDPGDALDTLAREATRFIKSASSTDAPFFLYIPLTAPHKPVWPHKRFVGLTGLGPYGDFVHQVDDTVGQVLASLEKHGVEENTLVVYTSDNGSFMYRRGENESHHLADETDQGFRPKDHTANGPWRGTKADIYEGGHRVPFLVRWPAGIRSGIRCGRTTCLTDVFATIADVIGEPLPRQAEDSFSFLAECRGEATVARPGVIHHSSGGHFAMREGKWKLILSTGSGGRQKPKGTKFEKPYQLYDLEKDPGETTNLIDKHPEVADRIEKAFEKIARNHKTSK